VAVPGKRGTMGENFPSAAALQHYNTTALQHYNITLYSIMLYTTNTKGHRRVCT
jgi:hypothetical protein